MEMATGIVCWYWHRIWSVWSELRSKRQARSTSSDRVDWNQMPVFSQQILRALHSSGSHYLSLHPPWQGWRQAETPKRCSCVFFYFNVLFRTREMAQLLRMLSPSQSTEFSSPYLPRMAYTTRKFKYMRCDVLFSLPGYLETCGAYNFTPTHR
jgi:hypothetical protein